MSQGKSEGMDYEQARAWIWGLTDYERRTGYDYSAARFDLARVHELLERLGNPQAGMPLVHVAGTKGKGSTSALIAASYRAAGLRTGLYTSPHLHAVRERIQVDGASMSREAFASAATAVAGAVQHVPGITTFEALTAMCLLHLARAHVDVVVLEVGMGGRLDATNVVRPFVSVISSISLDHVATLGPDVASIAREKAGIIKPGVPVVSTRQVPEAAAVIGEAARAVGAPLESVGAEWRYQPGPVWPDGQEFTLEPPPGAPEGAAGTYRVGLLGEHQIENAVLALAALSHTPARLGVAPRHWRHGLAEVQWPGRLEVAHRQPFVVLDGAHNVDSFERLGQALARHFPHQRLLLVFGASRDKDIPGMLAAIRRPELTVYGCASEHDRSAAVDALAEIARGLDIPFVGFGSVAEALWAAVGYATADDCVCVSGSLFVVAAARETIAERYGVLTHSGDEAEVVQLAPNWRAALVRA